MPGLNGLEATRQIRRSAPATKVVMLSGFVDEDQLLESIRAGASGYIMKKAEPEELILAIQTVQQQSIRAGASGYIMKKAEPEELILAIQTVHRGNNHYFSGHLSDGFDLAEVLYQAKRPEQRTGVDALTPREREVLQLIAEGYTNSRRSRTSSTSA